MRAGPDAAPPRATCQSKHPLVHQHLRLLVETAVDPQQRGSVLLHNPPTKQNCAALIQDTLAQPCGAGLSEDTVFEELRVVLLEYESEWRQWMMKQFEEYPDKISGNEGLFVAMYSLSLLRS